MQPLSAMISIQRDITDQVAEQFFPSGLNSAQRERLARLSTENSVAYQYYLEALGLIRGPIFDSGTLTRAANLFSLAITEDPGFASARAGLCETHTITYTRGGPHEPAREACELLVDADDVFEVQLALGEYLRITGRTDEAITALNRAARLNPGSADARIWIARAHADRFYRTQLERDNAMARSMYLEAIALQPNYWYSHHAYGAYLVKHPDGSGAV